MKRVIISFLLTAFNTAAVLQVPGEFETIQMGLDSAGTGDTVLVAPGTYHESITIRQDVVLTSHIMFNDEWNAQEETIISGMSVTEYVCTITNDSLITVQLVGFTFECGNSITGGIFGDFVELTVMDVTVQSFTGNGISLDNSDILLESTRIMGDEEYESRGIRFYNVTGSLHHVTIQAHHLQEFSAGMRILNSDIQLHHVQISENDSYTGGAVSIQNSDVIMDQCVIINNTTTIGNGGGLYIVGSTGEIRHSSIQNNAAPAGGGISIQNSDIILENIFLTENSANEGGGLLAANSSLTCNNSWIMNNTANEGGGIFSQLSNIILYKSVLSDNTATYRGGGVLLNTSDVDLLFSILTGNNSGQTIDEGIISNGQTRSLSSVFSPFVENDPALVFESGDLICHYSVLPSINETRIWEENLNHFSEWNSINLEFLSTDLFQEELGFYPSENSLLIDNGSFHMIDAGDTLLTVPSFQITGSAPDIGIYEWIANENSGDLNVDGQLDILDVLFLKLTIIDGDVTQNSILADFNLDLSVDILDVIVLLAHVLE